MSRGEAIDPRSAAKPWQRLVEQHDALRLALPPGRRRAGWRSIPSAGGEQELLWHVAGAIHGRMRRAVRQGRQRSLDLEQGPLLRAVLVDGPAGEQRLAAGDPPPGGGRGVLADTAEDLQKVYRQLDEGAEPAPAG
ncbi:hypothetical protein ACPA9J_18995 [Pseudomonas aeruginosa]